MLKPDLENANIAPLGGFGLMGKTQRVYLPDRSESLILKQPIMDSTFSSDMFDAELQFYQSGLAKRAGITIPELIYGESIAKTSSRNLIITDLGDEGFKSQLNGISSAQAELALRTIGKLHSYSMSNKETENLPIKPLKSSAVTKFCFHWLNSYEGKWPEFLGDIPTRIIVKFNEITAQLCPKHSAIVHGDFHSQNICFTNHGGQDSVFLIDFQFIQKATPMLDVARLIATSLQVVDRQEYEQNLIATHKQTIENFYPLNLQSDNLEYELRLSLLWNLLVPLSLHVRQVVTQNAKWPKNFPILDRCMQAVTDWRCVDLI